MRISSSLVETTTAGATIPQLRVSVRGGRGERFGMLSTTLLLPVTGELYIEEILFPVLELFRNSLLPKYNQIHRKQALHSIPSLPSFPKFKKPRFPNPPKSHHQIPTHTKPARHTLSLHPSPPPSPPLNAKPLPRSTCKKTQATYGPILSSEGDILPRDFLSQTRSKHIPRFFSCSVVLVFLF